MRFLLAAVAVLAALTHGHQVERRQAPADVSKKVVCYYTNWSVYRKGEAKYTPQNINPYLCTHLVYAFGGLTDEFEIKPFDSYQDIEQGGYAKFNGLKQYNKGLKTLLAIGGWNEGSGRFSELVSLPEYRRTFIISTIKHLRRYNFDGLDLDWEYPASRDGSMPEDRENYAALVKELREAFDDEGSKVKKGPLLLTMAVPAGKNYIDKGYDVPSLTRDLDFFNILNYDYHSAYEPSVNHHASLLPAPGTSEYAWNAELNVDWTVKYYISLGADKHKLVMGIPTYGRSFTLIDGNFTDFGASADGPGEQGKYTRENGFMAFYEVCENIASNGWEVRKPYPRRIGPYAFAGNQWVGYDDEKIVARKAEYVREHNLGGIMYWSLDNDDFRGICNGEQYPLVEAGKKALFGGGEDANEARDIKSATAGTRSQNSLSSRLQNRRRPSTTTPALTTTTTTTPRSTTPPTTTTTQKPASRPGVKRRRPGTRQRPQQQQRTTTIDPLNTPAPPTTPRPVSSFACKREGFYQNPDNCHKYYWCLDSGPSGLGIVAHAFTCPSDLVFNKVIDGCDHPSRARCSTDKKGRGGAAATTTTQGPTTPIPTTTEIPTDYSYYDDYYGDDEYYYDEEPAVAELPKPVEEVSNTVSRQLQNSGGAQFTRGSSSTTEATIEVETTSRPLGGRTRPQYASISRDRTEAPEPAVQEALEPAVQEAPKRRDSINPPLRGRLQYSAIERQRPGRPTAQSSPVEEEGEVREAELTTTGGRQYVTLDRRRPVADRKDTPALEAVSPTEPSRQYVVLERGRFTTPAAEEETPAVFEETTVTNVPEQTSRPSRNKLRSPTSTHNLPTRSFTRPRPTPQLEASEQPEARERPTRPLVGISPRPTLSIKDRPRPTRPSDDTPRLTRPLVQTTPRTSRPVSQLDDASPHPFLQEEDSRPLNPLISIPAPVTSPTTLAPTLAEEESITVFRQDFPETTLFPETSVRPTFSSLFSRPAATSPAPTTPTPTTTSTPRSRGSPRPRPSLRPTFSSTPRTTTTPPPPRSPRPVRLSPERVPLAPVATPGPAQSSIKDGNDYYDYYYDDLGGALTGTLGQLATTLTEKAVLMADGSVQCNDTGYFAHPDSCKKFISCSKTVRGLVRGWVYTCPQHLVFDPVGGMCNWAETVDCEGRK
nr:mucin-5AC-like isoform X4 [Procambarus clarkii]